MQSDEKLLNKLRNVLKLYEKKVKKEKTVTVIGGDELSEEEKNSEDAQKLEYLFEKYILSTDLYTTEIWDKLEILYGMSTILGACLKNFFEDNKNYSNHLPYLSTFDMIDLAKKYYDEIGIELDIDKLIRDGYIDFKFTETQENENIQLYGVCDSSYTIDEDNMDSSLKILYHEDEVNNYILPSYGKAVKESDNERLTTFPIKKKTITVSNNNSFLDLTTLIHELAHFRNRGPLNNTEARYLLTEALSTTEELIASDYFSKNGFELDSKVLIKEILLNSFLVADNLYPIYKLLLLYKQTGSISFESYSKYYNDDQYSKLIPVALSTMSQEKFDIFYSSKYLLAYSLAPYLFQQYKINPKFMEVINLLHKGINTFTFEECLSIMGATNLGREDAEKLRDAVVELRESTLENDKTITHF